MGSAEQEVADWWAEGAVWPLPVCDVVVGAVVESTPSGSRPRDPGSKASVTVTVGSQRFASCPRCSEEASLRHIFSRCSNPATPRSSLPSTNLGQLMQRHEADVLRFLCEAGYLDDEIESLMRH